MPNYTRAEVEAKLADIRSQLEDSLVPDGSTGLTRLQFGELRRELYRQEQHWLRVLGLLDRNAGCGTREY